MNHCMYVLYRSIFVRIFVSTNPQYDGRLITELQVKYMKILSSNLGRTCCVQKLFLTFRTIFVLHMFSTCSAKRTASDKDLPVVFILLLSLSYEVKYELSYLNVGKFTYELTCTVFKLVPKKS